MQKSAVIGAAGTGKTSLLIENVIRLLEESATDGDILILASSAHAINDIRARLGDVYGSDNTISPRIAVHTVRSLCEAVLQDARPELRIISDFRTWFTLRECIRSDSIQIQSSYIQVKDKRSFSREVLELLESTSINSISIDELPSSDTADKLEDIKNIHRYYKNFCQQHDLIPAFDIVPKALGLLNDYGKRFSHIFVDQYEDLCPGEINAIESLVGDHTNVKMFIDAGSADIPNDIENTETLDEAHRHLSADISEHVNRLLGKTIYPIREEDSQNSEQTLTIALEETAVDEAEYIARIIGRSGRKYSDFAILCRDVENLGGSIRDALKKHSIPYSGGIDISHDPLIQFILLGLQVAAGQDEDDVVLKWLSSPVAGLDRTDVYRAYTSAKKQKQDFIKTISGESASTPFRTSGDKLSNVLSLPDFIKGEIQNGQNIWEIVESIVSKFGPIGADSMSALPVFVEMVRDIEISYDKRPRLSEILNDIKEGLIYISNPDALICEDGDAVRIMSIQESKGLEFPIVFVPGMVSDFFPSRHPARQLLYGEDMDAAREVLRDVDLPGTVEPARWREQEKHLLYIAMTRAREDLYLTFARQYPDREDCEPSPFLMELLEGKELSEENCADYGIDYQDHAVSAAPDELPLLDNINSKTDLEIACYRYIKELERLDSQKAAAALELISSTDKISDLIPAESSAEFVIPNVSSRKFSNTAIRNFLSCPRRYFLSYLLRMDSEDRASAHFGRLVHDVLRDFHREHPVLSEYSLEELLSGMEELLLKAWDNRKESGFSGNQLQARGYLRLAREVLHAYLQGEHNFWENGRLCIQTERNLEFLFSDKYDLSGRIDRIDICPAGSNEIVDFKTSAYDKEGEAAMKGKFLNMDDDPEYKPQDFQLPIYYFAGLNDSDLDTQRLVIYQLRNLSKSTGTPFRRELEIMANEDTRSGKKDKFLTKADLESVKGDIVGTLEKMVSGLYPPDPRDDNVCERECDFSFLCDKEENNSQQN